jgi:hypothetical protein
MKYCHSTKDIPTTEHYAIVEFTTIYTPGDQRSIDFPGHGYPASSENVARYISFDDKTEWESEITKRTNYQMQYRSSEPFVAMKVQPAAVKTNVVVSID